MYNYISTAMLGRCIFKTQVLTSFTADNCKQSQVDAPDQVHGCEHGDEKVVKAGVGSISIITPVLQGRLKAVARPPFRAPSKTQKHRLRVMESWALFDNVGQHVDVKL